MERVTITSTPIYSHQPSAIAETALSYQRSDGRQADFSFILNHDNIERSAFIALIATTDEFNEERCYQVLELSIDELRLVRDLLNMPQIVNALENPPVKNLDDLLDLALTDLEMTRDQIVGDVFFSIGNGECEIYINDIDMHVSLCDISLSTRKLRECDWHVVDADL